MGIRSPAFHVAFARHRMASGHPLALEPEGAPSSDDGLMWNNMTWSNLKIPFTPYISHMKWLETRHMVNVSDRWNHDKTDDCNTRGSTELGM